MRSRRISSGSTDTVPLVSRFAGLQALACGLLGVVVSIGLDRTNYRFLATAMGVFVAITLVFIVIGFRFREHSLIWIAAFAISMFNLAGLYLLIERPNFQPIGLAPVLLVEVAAYILVIRCVAYRTTS